ncbi:hypothetical protein MPL3365_30071 [Mesorhizobium plurifarium]|uniref:Uncharacterized protein n=1 Tax=Mesorhizobium plurifarium TaxID=69974 RepID=A0A090GUZ9_MESPL|nr:hypothetical protein MPL3365_30071 [Mesorhizobium plurifarium]
MQLCVGQPVFRNQHVRFPGRLDEGATCVRCRTITFQRFEASVESITMALAAIERPNGHQALGGLAGASDLAIFADMAELDHHRLFKGLVVYHGRQRKTAKLVAVVARILRPNVSGRFCLTQFRTENRVLELL